MLWTGADSILFNAVTTNQAFSLTKEERGRNKKKHSVTMHSSIIFWFFLSTCTSKFVRSLFAAV